MISVHEEDIKEKPFVVFFFSGQGGIHNKLAVELYEKEPVFKKWTDDIDNILKEKYYGYSMIEKLKSINDDDREALYDQHLAHSILFILQISLFELYKHYDVTPDIIYGLSLGEIASSYCSGMIDLETACFVLYSRALSINKTFKEYDRTLVSVDISEENFNSKYSLKFPSIEIACKIHAHTITLGGKISDINQLFQLFDIDNVSYKRLPIASSFHTSSMESIKEEILNLSFDYSQPTITHFSTVTCKPFDIKTQPFNSFYLYNNIREPCLLEESTKNIYLFHLNNNNNNNLNNNLNYDNNNNNYKNNENNYDNIDKLTNQKKYNQSKKPIFIIEISAQYSLIYFIEKTIYELSIKYNDKNNNNNNNNNNINININNNNNNNKFLSTLYRDKNGDLNTFKNVISNIKEVYKN
ncbi:hypothetical protein ACTFIW_004729 [Dictyostelium discoideum]